MMEANWWTGCGLRVFLVIFVRREYINNGGECVLHMTDEGSIFIRGGLSRKMKESENWKGCGHDGKKVGGRYVRRQYEIMKTHEHGDKDEKGELEGSGRGRGGDDYKKDEGR